MNEELAREYYIKIKTLNDHAEKLTNHINGLDDQTVQIRQMIQAVQDVQEVDEGSNILAQLTQGVMIEATSKSIEHVFLNVGAETVVKKTPAEAMKLLEEQQQELSGYRKDLLKQREDVLQEANKIEKQAEEAVDV
jgi:prefoldin alpha subunit